MSQTLLEPVAAGQTRFRMQGLAPDARGIAIGREVLVVLPSLDALVAFLGAYSDEASLDDLLPTMTLEHARRHGGGHAVLVGIPAVQVTTSISPFQMVFAEKKLTGTYYGSIRPPVDFGVLADLDMDKRIDLDTLISRTYKFDEINEGFRLLTTGSVARGVIVF